ncbi:MAG TPA: DNA/RNA nuclease SfsA [Dongiaceae bacterium]|jgi:sugar fermentation stimulation protein A
MRFETPLTAGILVRRYKRFLADVTIDGRAETAHCANPGSMLGLAEPGSRIWLSTSSKPSRKLRLSWELIESAGGLVGINTGYANRLAEEALRAGRIEALTGYGSLRREVAYGDGSRVDFLLEDTGRPPCYVEVKSVTLKRGETAEFPDAVTARGTRHLRELIAMRQAGFRAVMLFLAQRGDCRRLTIAADIDPAYDAALAWARQAGVEMMAYACDVDPSGIELAGKLAF